MTFVDDVSPLLLVFGVLGWFPARMDPETKLFSSKIRPAGFFYCMVVNLVVILTNLPLLFSGIEAIWRSKDFFPMLAYLQTFPTFWTLLTPVLFASQTKNLTRILNEITEIQLALGKSLNANRKNSQLVITIGVFSSGLAFLMVVILVPIVFGVPIALPFAAGLCFINGALLITWWICIFQVLSATAKEISKHYRRCLRFGIRGSESFYISLLLKVRSLTENAGNTNVRALMIVPLSGSAILLFGVFQLAGNWAHWEAIAYNVFLIVFGAAVIITLCETAQSTSQEIRDLSLVMLKETEIKLSSAPHREHCARVLVRISKNPPKVSLHKYLELDRSLYMQLFPALASLLIVLLQLNISVKPLKLIDVFKIEEPSVKK